jgi:hypothetical protein
MKLPGGRRSGEDGRRVFRGGRHGGAPSDDALAAIAVPLFGRKRIQGSSNILWIKSA